MKLDLQQYNKVYEAYKESLAQLRKAHELTVRVFREATEYKQGLWEKGLQSVENMIQASQQVPVIQKDIAWMIKEMERVLDEYKALDRSQAN